MAHSVVAQLRKEVGILPNFAETKQVGQAVVSTSAHHRGRAESTRHTALCIIVTCTGDAVVCFHLSSCRLDMRLTAELKHACAELTRALPDRRRKR